MFTVINEVESVSAKRGTYQARAGSTVRISYAID
jgi:hypothetical protein